MKTHINLPNKRIRTINQQKINNFTYIIEEERKDE